MSTKSFYVSVDIETNGHRPPKHSILSIGAVVFKLEFLAMQGYYVPVAWDNFECNIKPLEGSVFEAETLEWWKQFPEQYAMTQVDQLDPADATLRFFNWLNKIPIEDKEHAKPVFVGWNACMDWSMISWYLDQFIGMNPFGFRAFDLRTATATTFDVDFQDFDKEKIWKVPGFKKPSALRAHVALDDAIEQTALFAFILTRSRQQLDMWTNYMR